MYTIEILNKRVSLYRNIHADKAHAITLFEALNSIRTGIYKSQIENVRRLYSFGQPSTARYKSKKKQLPSFLFSGSLFETKFKFDLYGYTSLLVIDIDRPESIDTIKESLKNDSYIISTWLSPSGNGLKALLYIEYDIACAINDGWIYHEHCAFPQVQKYLRHTYGIEIDHTGADISRLCFVSYDPNIHLKKEFEPFKVTCNLSNNKIHQIRWKYYSQKKIRNAINEQRKIAKLLNKSAD